jgi:hypothetical protein
MGDQHYAIVRTRIRATDQELAVFRAKLDEMFRQVDPLYPGWKGMYLIYEKDFANCETEIDMPDYVEELSGILSVDAEIVWSWDHPQISREREEAGDPRQRVWYIKGKNV